MASTFHGLELGKRALYAQQSALATTGHNIANANTNGYTRQRAEMQTTTAMPQPGMHSSTSPAQLGTGVEVTKIVRLRENYLDVQIRGEYGNLGYWQAKSDTLSKIEELLNEPSDNGLASVMDEFWNGWRELAKNPESAAARSVVKQRGVAVAETFQHLSQSFDQLQTDLNHVIDTKLTEVNSLAKQISSLNDQIGRLVPNNYQPNDLYDQRDALIDRLSQLVPVKVGPPNSSGMVDISVGDGLLVSGNTYEELSIVYPDAGLDDPAKIKVGEAVMELKAGELQGRIEAHSQMIPDMKDQINEMARVFVEEVNDIHKTGRSPNNMPEKKGDELEFFIGSTAGTIEVNPNLSLDAIAAASLKDAVSGNGENAQNIADLKFDGTLKFFDETTSTIDDFYRNIIGQLGIDAQEATRMQDNSEVIVQQVENRRLSVSGVSLDEEMTNMIRFQQAYNAAARYVTTMDQCLEKVINGMGRVGL